jgi:hypothetical protein
MQPGSATTQDEPQASPAAQATPDGTEVEKLYLAQQELVRSVRGEAKVQLEKDPGFAGTWLDVDAGWVVDVATTGDPAAVEEVLAAFKDRGVGFRVRKVEYTLAELRALHEEVKGDAATWQQQGLTITSIRVDVKANRLAIGVQDLSPEAANSLQSGYGDRVTTHAEGVATAAVCSSRFNCAGPMKGGLAIQDYYGDGVCTSGFVTRDIQWAGAYYLMTAGHCLNFNGNGVSWLHNALTFGTSSSFFFFPGSDVDVGYVLLSAAASPGNQIFVSTTDIRSMTGFVPNVDQDLGDWVCKSGRTTNYSCGQIDEIDVSKLVSVPSGNILIDHYWGVGMPGDLGDSGSPMMFGTNGYGIFSAIDFNTQTVYYSTMDWIRLTTGKTMCVNAACN